MAVITTPLNEDDEQMLLPVPDLVEYPVSMDVEQQESAVTVETEKVDEPNANRFTWVIEDISSVSYRKHCSGVFRAGGCGWRVLLFPKGDHREECVSMFLDIADAMDLPYGWSRYAQFSITLVNQFDVNRSIKKDALHNFNSRVTDWGFSEFMRLHEFYNPAAGFVVNDKCIIIADVAVRRIVNNWLYDSKKETGFVGLKNQGATCYMNSLLQMLYHIPYFRKAMYQMPTNENASSGSMELALALQILFYKIQYNDKSVSTKDLTKSFGWNSHDSFMQHDVQELNRVLCEKLEDKMKGTVVEGTIGRLFEGHLMNYIECINVDMKSTRKESFYDLQLDVKGCPNVYASLDKFVDVERLEGDNKYHAEEHGLQDAKKGILFTDFPPVLQLHLKRFEYDFRSESMVKINDRYEFPLELDLDRENGKYLSHDADRTIRNIYLLHSILVHSGGVHGGHYYAYIRPNLSDQWFKFDDERVTKEDVQNATEEQFGGEEKLPEPELSLKLSPIKFTRFSNAYMLVYVRESDKEKIMCDVGEKEIPDHLRLRIGKEREEKERLKKFKAEAYLYTSIKVIFDDDLKQQIGNDIHFDLANLQMVRSFRVRRQKPFLEFKEELAKELGSSVQCLRFWIWEKRGNNTQRPSRPIEESEELKSIDELKMVIGHGGDMKLFLEIESGPDKFPVPLTDIPDEDILLFFKLYDPKKEKLQYVGRLFVKSSCMPVEIFSKLNHMVGFAPDEELQLFEELAFRPDLICNRIDEKASFQKSQLENGDIICFQKVPESPEQYHCPDVPSFFSYLLNRLVIHFRSLARPREDEFSLELSKLHTYDDVVEKLADRIGLGDPSRIRLTGHSWPSQQPRAQPLRYQAPGILIDMLIQYNRLTDILYYEVLDIPLPELLQSKVLDIDYYNATKNEVTSHKIRISKSETVADLLFEVETRVQLTNPEAGLRLLGIVRHKILRVFSPNLTIEHLDDVEFSLRAEEIPEEEKVITSEDRLIHVYHFMKPLQNLMFQYVQTFGEPLIFVIHGGETLAQVKLRIQKKLQVPDEEFSKWKFASVLYDRPNYLQDADNVFECFKERRPVYGDWEHYLGLEHTDTTPKKAFTTNNHNRSTFDRSVKIYN